MTVAIGPDRSKLYAIDVASRRVREVLTWSGSAPIPANVIGFEAVVYSPDGQRVAVTEEDEPADRATPTASRLVMLDASTGRPLWQRRYPLRRGQADPHVIFTSASTLLTSGQQGDTLLWDARTGRIRRRYPLGGVAAPAPNGRTVALAQNSVSPGDQSASITLLDLRTGRHRLLLANLPDNWIRSLSYTRDGSELAGAATDSAHVWNVASGKIIENYVAGAGPHSLSVLDRNGDILIVGHEDGSVAAFDVSGSQRLGRGFSWNTPEQQCGYAPCMAINRQATLMATDQEDGTAAVIDLTSHHLRRTLPARDGATAPAIAFMPDGRTLVTGGTNGDVTFWDVDSGTVIRTLHFAQPVGWVASSPDGKLVAIQTGPLNGSMSRVDVVRLSDDTVVQRHPLPSGSSGVEFSHDGRELVALACCGNGSALLAWDAHTGRQLFRLGADLDASAFDISPDSRRVGVGTASGEFVLLDALTGHRAAQPIQVGTADIYGVAFSPDDRRIAVSSLDGTASVWSTASRARLGSTFGPYPGDVPAVQFESNGRLLIELPSSAIEWPMDVNTWERFACRAAGRELTRSEWHDLLPNRAYRAVCRGLA
jgi:WD40 repeat protein